jgi:hypothetical protein
MRRSNAIKEKIFHGTRFFACTVSKNILIFERTDLAGIPIAPLPFVTVLFLRAL